MLFNSFDFLFAFLPVTWALYVLFRITRMRPVILIVSGYIFYSWGRPKIAILLFLSSTVDFVIGLVMERTERLILRRLMMVLSLVFNLGLLAIFKYSAWIFGGINQLILHFHHRHLLPILDVPLPPGISFYTFQSLAYIIDIYRRKIHAHRKPLDYYAFVAFFPQLFAGPIERAGQLLPQIVHPVKRIHPRMIEMGLFMIGWGLLKKVVVADNMANLIDLTQNNIGIPCANIVLLLAFTCQIYADFSGYTDIARGTAKLFGIKLRRNFLTPYFSINPSDFWQRWHISLSSWIRDYVYISLGGNRAGKLRTLFNLFTAMFLAGLWHGAGVFFLCWGMYHGTLLIIYRFVPIDRHLVRRFGLAGKLLAMLLMFVLTAIGWGLFYAGSHGNLLKIFFPEHPPAPQLPGGILWYGLFLFSLPLLVSEVLGYLRGREFTDLWLHISVPVKICLLLLIFYGIVFFGARDTHEFIYFQF